MFCYKIFVAGSSSTRLVANELKIATDLQKKKYLLYSLLMPAISKNNSIHIPNISPIGLIDLPIQKELLIPHGEVVEVDLQYGIKLEKGTILDFVVCGELRREGLRLYEGRHLHTTAHKPKSPIRVLVHNISNDTMRIKAGHHAFHALPLNLETKMQLAYD